METPVFVVEGRETQLDQLRIHISCTLAGQPQLVFITGDAGTGKTALVRELCHRAQKANGQLIIAWGQCNAQLGLSDPYLPFKEILALLTGDTSGGLATRLVDRTNAERLKKALIISGEILCEVGPDLVGIFVPGATLLGHIVSVLGKAIDIGWVEQLKKRIEQPPSREDYRPDQLFEQFSRVMIQLAKRRPLVLVLDDLQWADNGTLDLLFYLTRRVQKVDQLPLMILGLYRPADVELGRDGTRHPLERVVNELRRYWGDIEIDLTPTLSGMAGRAFVDALLDTEPNRLDEVFRTLLFRRTEGHPLFTVELLRSLRERGVLAKDDQGRWFLARPVTYEELPQKVEAVIEERIERLEEELKSILTCGSVEGEQFTAEVVARVRQIDKLHLAEKLDQELTKRYRLLRAASEVRADRQRLHPYRFRHVLFQQYLYNGLGKFLRERLHRAVGDALETLYREQIEKIAGELARHFDLAGEVDKAIHYYRQAADQARESFANEDALRLYNRALELLSEEGDAPLRYKLLAGREQVYDALGRRGAQRADLESMLAMAGQFGNDQWLAEAHNRCAFYYERVGSYAKARAAAEAGLAAARQAGYAHAEVEGLNRLARIAYRQSKYAAARETAQAALDLARQIGERRAEAIALNTLGGVHRDTGEIAAAIEYYAQALDIQHTLGNRVGEAYSVNNLGLAYYDSGNYSAARAYHEEALTIGRAIGDRYREISSLSDLGIVYKALGDYETARAYLERGLTFRRTIGDRRGEATNLNHLGHVLCKLGEYDSARTCLEEALSVARTINAQRHEAEGLTYLGLAFEGLDQLSEAAQAYTAALQLRRNMGQQARAIEDLAGLARIAIAQADLPTAKAYVEEALAWLTEHGADGVDEPLCVYRICIHVLEACGESDRMQATMQDAYRLLMKQANKIDDPVLRGSFLNNVQVNREILTTWQAE